MKCARKEITLPINFKSKSYQKEFELDTTLPDFLPNISRPVRVDAKVVVESISPAEDKVEINGKIVYGFLYISDHKESLKFTEFVDNFVMRSEVTGIRPTTVILPNIICTGVSCKMLNPRKFLLRSKWDIAYMVNNSMSHSLIDEKSEGCFFKTDTFTAYNLRPVVTREFSFSDTNDIGDAYSAISEIVTKNINIASTEHSVGDGYINIKANAILKVMCIENSADEEVFMVSKNVATSMIVEDEAIGSDSLCYIDISPTSLSTEVSIDSYGENKVVSSKFGYCVDVYCYNPEIITIATDVFAANTTNTQKPTELRYNRLIGIDKKVFTIEKIIETGETEFSKLYDSSAMLTMNPGEISGKETICNGSALISLLGETSAGVDLIDVAVNFTERIPATDISEMNVRAVDVSAAAVGNANVSLKIIAVAEYKRCEDVSVIAIENCEFTDIPKSENAPNVLIYYPSQEDDLWSVAKRYGIAPDNLKAGNADRFDGDKIVSKVVLIPQRQV